MVAGQLAIREVATAIETHVTVTAKERLIGERRNTLCRWQNFAVARDDAVDVDAALGTVEPGMTTTNVQYRFAQGPDHDFARIQAHGVTPAHPFNGSAADVQPQNSRYPFIQVNRCDHVSLTNLNERLRFERLRFERLRLPFQKLTRAYHDETLRRVQRSQGVDLLHNLDIKSQIPSANSGFLVCIEDREPHT